MTLKNWVDEPRVVRTSSGWSVRIEGCDVFDVVNQYGVKPRRAFDVVSGLKTEQDAKDFLMGWLRDQLPVEHHQGEPVADVVMHNGEKIIDGNMAFMATAQVGTKLYTHADPGEVERLDKDNTRLTLELDACLDERDTLRAQLAEQSALLKIAKPYMKGGFGSVCGAWQESYAALSASAEPILDNKGIKNHAGQKLLVQHILDNDKGLSHSSRVILEKLIGE